MPIERRIRASVLVVDADARVLLFRGGDPARPEGGTWWFTPGGGVETGEDVEDAARRELREETGLSVSDLGSVVLRRHAEFQFNDVMVDQHEVYFLVRTMPFEIDTGGWTPGERQIVEEHRWWSLDELGATPDRVYPGGLAALLDSLI
jgi:8-oxo-dGTP pyrophosphatase MutT (NUDIX family)